MKKFIFTKLPKLLNFKKISKIPKYGKLINLSIIKNEKQFFSSINENEIYVSSHFYIENEEIMRLLDKFNLEYKIHHNGNFILKVCPFCTPHKNLSSNLWKLNIKKNSGSFYCFRCGIKGSWFYLKKLCFNGFQTNSGNIYNSSFESFRERSNINNQEIKEEKVDENSHFLLYKNLFEEKYKDIIQIFKENNISINTLKKYKIGVGDYEFFDEEKKESVCIPSIYFPMFCKRKINEMQKLKTITFDENQINNSHSYFNRTKIQSIYNDEKNFKIYYPSHYLTWLNTKLF